MGKRVARAVFEYDTVADFEADGGVAAYGDGELIINGRRHYIENGILVLNRYRRRAVLHRNLGGDLNTAAGTPGGYTWSDSIELPCQKFFALKLHYESVLQAPIEKTIITKVACGVNDGSVAHPGFVGALVNGTFGGAAKGEIPIQVGTKNPGLLDSDWIQIGSKPRVDGGEHQWAIARTVFQSPDGAQTSGVGTGSGYSYTFRAAHQAWNDAGNIKWLASGQAVDGIANPASFTNASQSGNIVLRGISWLTDQDCLPVAIIGDSLVSGTNTANDMTPWGYLACKSISTPKLPVVPNILGIGGSWPHMYYPRSIAAMNANKPRIAIYQVTSVNEPVASQDIADKHFFYALQFLDWCFENRVIPGITTGFPHTLGSVAADVYRQGLITRVMNLRNIGVAALDTSAIVADPSAPWRFLPEYKSISDNSHMSQLGNDVVAPFAADFIKTLAGI
ncbi:hypothetical protein ACH5Y9_05340 [Methylomonas sp. BW4-1]|uniref:hypothetical protein n=1 Tax=Methylomonas sp. BW4-1 TaxID=3376685 RepID=UPI0040438FFD